MKENSVAAVKLLVFMEPSDEQLIKDGKSFCCDPDPAATKIVEFCKRSKKLPYSLRFVSVAVLRAGESPCESRAEIYSDDGNVLGRSRFAVLKDSVLSSIDIVGQDDLRQLLTQIADRFKNNTPYDSLLNQVQNLVPMNENEKLKALYRATLNRGNHGYSEARLNRCITSQDVEDWGECN